jgi:hypothetical protein
LAVVEADTLGAGKSRLARASHDLLVGRGFAVGGLWCPSIYDGTRWIGQQAVLLPEGRRFWLQRIDRPAWDKRTTFGRQAREHPRITDDRRAAGVDPRAADACLNHLLQVLDDTTINALVFDELGTVLGGESRRQQDPRLFEASKAIAAGRKEANVVTVQIRGQHRQHLAACVEVLRRATHVDVHDLVLDAKNPYTTPAGLQNLAPAP